MKDYMKSIAVLAILFSTLAIGTYATTRSDQAIALARASARVICSQTVTDTCRPFVPFRMDRSSTAPVRS